MFQSARIKLTLYYLAIIMLISLLFSAVIYSGVNREYTRFERIGSRIQKDIDQGRLVPIPSPGPITRFEPQMVGAARTRLIIILFGINFSILGLAGAAGYFLAGRTLRPIKEMVDEQNRFITDSSHELRTPLTSLRSEIEVALRNKKLTIDESRRLLESNLEETISLQVLSDRLLELAQNGSKTNHVFTIISTKQIIEAATRKIEPIAAKKQIKIENKVRDSKVKGVEDRLVEIFVILLDNAVKYSPKKGLIKITSKQEQGMEKILVTDEGIGISKKNLENIFERFWRADTSRSQSEGFGLGLSIAKKIIESHNGKIEVESREGAGTTFTVFLPNAS